MLTAAAVNTECDTALSDINLDHLCKTATGGADMTTEVVDNSILSRVLANGDTSAFVPSTDGLQPIRVDVDAILADTGTDGVVLANDAITSAKYDESTAFPVKSADTGATQIARTGADSDTLEVISDEIQALNNLSAADVNAECDTALTDYDPPTKAEMDTAHALLATVAKQDVIDGIVDAILLDTGTDGVLVNAASVAAAVWNAAQTSYTTSGSLADRLQWIVNVLEGDKEIETTVTPYDLVIKKKGTATELIRKELFQADGTNLTAETQIVGQQQEP